MIRNSSEYRESLKSMKPNIYMGGEVLGRENIPGTEIMELTCELAHNKDLQHLTTAKSHLTGETINRFCHIHQSPEDLLIKQEMTRTAARMVGGCIARCMGIDAMNALSVITYQCDQVHGTEYHQRWLEYLKYWQENDIVGCCAQSDVKGHRKRRPHEQTDPDLYLRVVEKRKDGIVVRGAKAHQTGALNSHEILVMPTAAMRKDEADYTVSFAVPADAEGITFILGRQPSDTRKLEGSPLDVGNFKYGSQEALVIFDDVFVPWERVFMCGEYDQSGKVVERFAAYHRQSYGGCKVGVGDVLVGAAQLAAVYQGVEGASHVRDKITEMIHLNETLFSCGIACSARGEPTPSGCYLVDVLLANVCKQNVTRFPFEISRLLQDIAGGLVVTMPSQKDFENPEIAPYLEKYLKGSGDIPTLDRIKVLKFIENMTMGCGAAAYLTESIHGAGSPQAQRIMIRRLAGLEEKVKLVKRLVDLD